MITLASLEKLWPHALPGLNEAVAASEGSLALNGFNTKMRAAHLMAQVSHECGAGSVTVENLNYSTAARIRAVWPSRFPTDADAQPFVRNPQGLANKVYNGRMGNRLNTDDGWTYRGRGLIQTTGHDGYKKLGDAVGTDLVTNPSLVNELPNLMPFTCVEVRGYAGMFTAMDADDIRTVTHLINGGYNGLAERTHWLDVWKRELADG